MKKLFASVLSLAMACSLCACGQTTDQPAETTDNGTGELVDGTYTASVNGMNDKIEVALTVENKDVKSIEVTSNKETVGIGSPLYDKDGNCMLEGGEAPTTLIPNEILKHKSIKVDNVTGATITSAAIKAAVKDCLEQAGANIDDWKKDVTYTTVEGIDSDVIVLGGGGAGLAAAVSAAEQGKSVTVIEKNGEMGGDTLVCGAIYNTPDAELQKEVTMSDPVKETIEAALAEEPVSDEHAALQNEVKAQWDAYKAEGRTDLFDSKEWYALQTWISGDKVGRLPLVKTLCYNSYDGLKWIEGLGLDFIPEITQGAGSLWQRTHCTTMNAGTGFMSAYAHQLKDHADKITFVPEMTAKELILTDGKVTGVKAIDNHTDEEVTYNAKDGVILATGGFAGNAKLVESHNDHSKWGDLSKTMTTNRIGCSQGDGIVMAENAGADLADMDQIQLLYLGNCVDGQISKTTRRSVKGTDQIMFINKDGKRFVQEDGRRDQICGAVLQQPDEMFYILESGDGDQYVDIHSDEWTSFDGFTFDYCVDNGYIMWDDTLEGLAEKAGMDKATLQATVDQFNADVEAGEDKEFGRKLYSTKLENGPWVLTARKACLHHTMGGVAIDAEGHVLDKEGNPIEGLYAAGEITGGIHGANRLGGNAVVDTVVYGKLAGESVVADAE